MTGIPSLLGDNQIFQPDFSASSITLLEKEIQSFTKQINTAVIPTFEIGPLGQVSLRQLNSAVPLYVFNWQLTVDDDKKEILEGMVATQQHNYSKNNARNNVDITFTDNKQASLELEGFSRTGTLIKPSGVERDGLNPLSNWKFVQYNIKFTAFSFQRYTDRLWVVDMQAVESELNIS